MADIGNEDKNKTNKILRKMIFFIGIIIFHDLIAAATVYMISPLLIEFPSGIHGLNPVKSKISGCEKICNRNKNRLIDAVEMYNMDHSEKMDKLDIDLLIEEKYITPLEPESNPTDKLKCIYTGNNLSKDGHIVCNLHDGDKEKLREQIMSSINFHKGIQFIITWFVVIAITCII